MKSVGCGASSAERFCALMNMPPIARSAPYSSHNKALLKAAKDACFGTMNDAAKEMHVLKNKCEGEVADCGISCDGTLQRRGFSSLNGCVTAISKPRKLTTRQNAKQTMNDQHQQWKKKGLVGSSNALWREISFGTQKILVMDIARAMVLSKIFTTVVPMVQQL